MGGKVRQREDVGGGCDPLPFSHVYIKLIKCECYYSCFVPLYFFVFSLYMEQPN